MAEVLRSVKDTMGAAGQIIYDGLFSMAKNVRKVKNQRQLIRTSPEQCEG